MQTGSNNISQMPYDTIVDQDCKVVSLYIDVGLRRDEAFYPTENYSQFGSNQTIVRTVRKLQRHLCGGITLMQSKNMERFYFWIALILHLKITTKSKFVIHTATTTTTLTTISTTNIVAAESATVAAAAKSMNLSIYKVPCIQHCRSSQCNELTLTNFFLSSLHCIGRYPFFVGLAPNTLSLN